jgi:CubicO group peptidase (beta-lactamase class C family)
MNGRKSIAILWVLLLSGALYAHSNDDVLSARVDDGVRAQMKEQNIPGVSLAVMRDGKIIKATGYGLANVELNVPMAAADAPSYRIPRQSFHCHGICGGRNAGSAAPGRICFRVW